MLAARLSEDPASGCCWWRPARATTHRSSGCRRPRCRCGTGPFASRRRDGAAALRAAGRQHLPGQRQDARRRLVDQRHGLHPGQPGRLRRLAGRPRLSPAGVTPTCCRTSAGPRTTARGPSAFHGVGGPLRVEDVRYEHPLTRRGWTPPPPAGLPANADFNGAAQDGVGRYQATQRAGRRWSAADAYLRPAPAARGNLTVRTGVLATRRSWSARPCRSCTRYRDGGTEQEVRAGRRCCSAPARSPARNC